MIYMVSNFQTNQVLGLNPGHLHFAPRALISNDQIIYLVTLYQTEPTVLHLRMGRIQPPVERGGARRDGGAGRGRAAQDADDGTVRPGENQLANPPDDGRMTSWVRLWKQEQGKSYANRWRNKTRG